MIFLNSASSAAALVFYLPGVCTHNDTEGKQRKARVRNILKSSKKTQYLMNTLYIINKNKKEISSGRMIGEICDPMLTNDTPLFEDVGGVAAGGGA